MKIETEFSIAIILAFLYNIFGTYTALFERGNIILFNIFLVITLIVMVISVILIVDVVQKIERILKLISEFE